MVVDYEETGDGDSMNCEDSMCHADATSVTKSARGHGVAGSLPLPQVGLGNGHGVKRERSTVCCDCGPSP